KAIDRLKRVVDGVAMKVLEQDRDLREQVLIRHYQRRARAPRRQPSGETNDRWIGESDHHIRAIDLHSRITRGQEIGDVVGRPADEATLVEAAAARAKDLDAVVLFAADQATNRDQVIVR